jgi:hypothetical protein
VRTSDRTGRGAFLAAANDRVVINCLDSNAEEFESDETDRPVNPRIEKDGMTFFMASPLLFSTTLTNGVFPRPV